ncbi:MAG: dihydroneopterin aldolase [Vulcanimicrobiaceae bacterium]
MDRITIGGIFAYGRHGADPGERDAPQRLELDLAIEVDLSAAERSDDLRDTVDYAAVHARTVRIVESTSFALLERLAGEILTSIFADARIARAGISIAKPQILDGASPAVELIRENPSFRAAP